MSKNAVNAENARVRTVRHHVITLEGVKKGDEVTLQQKPKPQKVWRRHERPVMLDIDDPLCNNVLLTADHIRPLLSTNFIKRDHTIPLRINMIKSWIWEQHGDKTCVILRNDVGVCIGIGNARRGLNDRYNQKLGIKIALVDALRDIELDGADLEVPSATR